MLQVQGRNRLRDLSIAVILAVMFSQIGFLVLLFTVPLYTLYYRKGSKDLLIAAGSVMFLLIILSVLKTRSVDNAELRGALVIIEIIVPILLMLGMFFVIDIIPALSGFRRLYRLFFGTIAAVVVFIPFFMVLQQNDVFKEALGSQINAVAQAVFGEGSGTYESEVVKTYLGEEGILGYMKSFYMKSAAAMYFLVLLIGMRISEMIISRLRHGRTMSLTEFKVPEILLWPILISAVGMVLEIFGLIDLGYLSAAMWNIGIILMFIYGLQGLAIIRVLFFKFKLPVGLRMMIEFILILMIVMPGINYIVIIGLPVLGISETWINLRKPIRST